MSGFKIYHYGSGWILSYDGYDIASSYSKDELSDFMEYLKNIGETDIDRLKELVETYPEKTSHRRIEMLSRKLRKIAWAIQGSESEVKSGLVQLLSEYMGHASKRINLDVLEGRGDVLHLFGQFLDVLYSFSDPDPEYSSFCKKIKPYLSRDPSAEESAWVSNATDAKMVTLIKRALQSAWPGLLELFREHQIDNRKW